MNSLKNKENKNKKSPLRIWWHSAEGQSLEN